MSLANKIIGSLATKPFLFMLVITLAIRMQSAVPGNYAGKPFDDVRYRIEQADEANRAKLPYKAFVPVLTLWDSKDPKGAGWVGKEEPGATIGLDEPASDGRRVIHYHVKLNNYRYAVFGWQWAGESEQPVDLRQYDAVSFSIRVTGPKRPQELFFGVNELQPMPVTLRDYDPDVLDGAWHHITIPVNAMKWTDGGRAERGARSFAIKTFVWDPAEYDVQLDGFALERLVNPAAICGAVPVATVMAAAKPQVIPGRIEGAFYDLGGEGVAYHDTTPINILSGVLNQQPRHQRPHATAYEWNFRREEGVDVSFTKDWADLNHTNLFDIGPNQLYIGGTEDGEWCNYTVEIKCAGKYKIVAAYGNDANGRGFQFSLNGRPASVCQVPLVTGSMHKWNRAEVGTIEFPDKGRQLLTLHYGRGFNLAYFDFVMAH